MTGDAGIVVGYHENSSTLWRSHDDAWYAYPILVGRQKTSNVCALVRDSCLEIVVGRRVWRGNMYKFVEPPVILYTDAEAFADFVGEPGHGPVRARVLAVVEAHPHMLATILLAAGG